jgi:F5/8 type C domain
MDRMDSSRMHKRLMSDQVSRSPERPGELDVASLATFGYSSEDPDHPLEHLIDGRGGPGGTRWASARHNTTERIELEFEPAQRISRLVYEAEELRVERTQEVRVEISTDHGRTYHQLLMQDYTFSPRGATFQHEELRLELDPITNLNLTIVPNKAGSGTATLTALRLFAWPV